MTVATEFTPTQARLMEILKDGHAHPVAQLWACIGDDMATDGTLRVHITYLREALRGQGRGILCDRRGPTTYRLVRLIDDDE
jgi:DNA-binding winged helix-turn-helix (wHTH) protein